MAAVDVLRSPNAFDAMPPKQRAPLSNLPHALNSPVRASKRSRADGKTLFDDPAAPPSKRIHLDQDHISQQERENIPPNPVTPPRRKLTSALDTHLGHGGRSDAIDRDRLLRQQALVAREQKERAREREREAQRERQQQQQQRAQNELRQDEIVRWQRYYEKKFPDFVFYFENVPEDARRKCSREVRELGAHEDRFFSRAVTHVVTTRSIPSEVNTPIEEEQPTIDDGHTQGTINPSLLDKRNRPTESAHTARSTRGKSVFDVALSKKAGFVSPNKTKAAKVDVLQKARDLGIKIWQLEKLQRVLRVMFEDEDEQDYADPELHKAISRVPKKQSETLSRLIKREEQTKSHVYDHHAVLKTELIPLSEPYIFVRCMNEKTKPLMVRQYPKVVKSTEGEWPQFRPVTQGKCPFIIEDNKVRRAELKKEKEREKAEKQEQRVTRAQAAEVEQKDGGKETHLDGTKSRHFEQEQNLRPYESAATVSVAETIDQTAATRLRTSRRGETQTVQDEEEAREQEQEQEQDQEDNVEPEGDDTEDDPAMQDEDRTMRADEDATTDAPQVTPTQSDFSRAGNEQIQHSRQTSFDLMAPPAALPRPHPGIGRPGGEPTASGIQRSGATAMIRSTMGISSAAAQPGLKAPTSRDVHSLQRRVLDRYSTGSGSTLGMSERPMPSAHMAFPGKPGLTESRGMIDIAGRARAENPRAAKTKAQEKLHVQYRPTGEQDQVRALPKATQRKELERQAAKAKREPKPGYCENCKDKFDDFEEHIQSRKHRKFATTKENWAELDALLAHLERPLKRKLESSDDDTLSESDPRYMGELIYDQRAHKRSRVD